MTNKEIASLVSDMKDGDDEAFEQIYEKLWNSLYFSARKQLNNEEDAKDVVQETMIEISQNIHKLKNELSFIAWANRILFYNCVHMYKTSVKFEHMDLDKMDNQLMEEKIEFLPQEVLENKETCKEISKMVSQLPQKQKEAILLYYFNGFSTTEISETIGSNPAAVQKSLSVARKAIKDKLQSLQRKGGVMYSVTTMPILTSIFMQEMDEICTPEIKEEMFKYISGVLGSGVAATSGASALLQTSQAAAVVGTTTAGTAAVSTSLVIKISASILAIVCIGGGVSLSVYKQQTPDPVVASVMSSPMPNETSSQAITTTEPIQETVETLDDIVGIEDANIIRSWAMPSTENNHDAFISMVEKHGLEMDSVFVDVENNSDMYVVFCKEVQGKRLLMCEYFNVNTKKWSAVYSVENLEVPIPRSYEISVWFENTQAKLEQG